MAAVRTLLSLVRTGAVISGGGALVTELLVRAWPRWVVGLLSSAFVLVGYWLMWSAIRTAMALRTQIERERPGQGFLYPHRQVVAVTLVLQILIAIAVALYLIRG
jgi:hypothetical protein